MIEVVSKSVNLVIPHAILQALGPLPVYLAYDYMIHGFGNSSTPDHRPASDKILPLFSVDGSAKYGNMNV